ncbi:MAG TPA: cell division protein FtsQ/DivIB [bacterium]
MASRRIRRRSVVGVIPRFGGWLWGGVRWLWQHPSLAAGCALTAAAVWLLWDHTNRAEAFRVTRVTMPPGSGLTIDPSLMGSNIWQVDIGQLARALERQRPTLKHVRVIRDLPDRIRIDVIEREPVAFVRVNGWLPVDAEGFILPEGTEADEGLPRVHGVGRLGAALHVGRRNADERLQLALRVLEQLRRAPALADRRLSELDVSNPRQLRFLIDDSTEIRCGSEAELAVNLRRLRDTMAAIGRRDLAVRYIDLRFDDPVVAPRT